MALHGSDCADAAHAPMDERGPQAGPPTGGWHPFTKLQPPQLGDSHVGRRQLQAALRDAVLRHRLTLIAAPAGSGKTNLAATLAAGVLPATWIALDAADDDLFIFVSALEAGLRPQLRDGGHAIRSFLQSVPNALERPARLGATLINSLRPDAAPPAVLILDDYHVITEPAIHALVAYLVNYLPDSLRLLIVTRHDPPLPLPQLRARCQLAEFRLSQLRFAPEETAAFLNERHRLALSEAELLALQHHTEGWVAGLQLLAMLLAEIEGPAARSRYIGRLGPFNRSIFELLASEVLDIQPPEIREFLLQTAILPELTPALCRAVTGDPAAPQLLEAVCRRNLFVRALTPDAQDGPFRYHDLFAGFLQLRLRSERPERWRELHRRAAQAAASAEQRLAHLGAAELWDEAAQLLEQMGQEDTERRFTRRAVVAGIEALPEPVRLAHPWLLLFVGQYYAIRGQVAAAERWLARAAERFAQTGDELGGVELLAAQAMYNTLEGEALIAAFRQKVAAVPQLLRPDHWAIYHGSELWYAVATYDWPHLTGHLRASMELAARSGDPGALTIACLTIGPHMLFNDAGPAAIEAFATRCMQLAAADDWILRICSHAALGCFHLLRGALDPAERAGREAQRLLEEIGGLAFIDDHVGWLQLAVALARRDYHGFDRLFAAQEARWSSQATSAGYRQGFLYLRGRSLWLRDRLAEARAVLAEMRAMAIPTGQEPEDEARRLLLASLIAMQTGDGAAAEFDLRRAIALHRKVRHTVLLSHPRLALATLYARRRRWGEALDELRATIHELRELPGVILQEGESIAPLLAYAVERGVEPELLEPLLRILQTGAGARPVALPGSPEHLTAREAEVLGLLATGATNPAIADRLSITERTVKAHVTRILAKLEVSTRTEAVSRAIQLGLVRPG